MLLDGNRDIERAFLPRFNVLSILTADASILSARFRLLPEMAVSDYGLVQG
ncbi:hypothetical protein [Hyphobacterium sp. CCMP332]|uniref:hypothetical protein n=1 Tax=Hyphobacterium sp. CCMP332 TaxID=2749086 RepID=UPI001F1DE9C1|nr:hypothetical protein [Hyphobacterium sp. CCMP332]